MDKIKIITVIGAGTMGSGIAHVCAQAGYQTGLYDISNDSLANAKVSISKNINRQISKGINISNESVFSNLVFSNDLELLVSKSDLVIEAATENELLKIDIFSKICALAPANTILASNTSSISITKLASATKRPAQVIGMHFMNPVPVMKLVELIKGQQTSLETVSAIVQMSESLGKIAVVANDYPGFVANRILMPMINEAIHCVYEGVADIEAIDTIMKLGMAHPMGPLQLADFIGLDVCHAILQVLHQGLGQPKYFPCPLLTKLVQAGQKGAKTRQGFYIWEAGKITKPAF